MIQDRNQEQGLALHQHRQGVDGFVTGSPAIPHRVLLLRARVRFCVRKIFYRTIIKIFYYRNALYDFEIIGF